MGCRWILLSGALALFAEEPLPDSCAWPIAMLRAAGSTVGAKAVLGFPDGSRSSSVERCACTCVVAERAELLRLRKADWTGAAGDNAAQSEITTVRTRGRAPCVSGWRLVRVMRDGPKG